MMKLTRFKLALLLYCAFDFLIGGHCGGLLPLGEMAAAQTGPAIGNITSAGSTCSTTSTPTNCVILQLDGSTGAVSIDISGTWAATLQFEAFGGATWAAINCTPPNSTVAVTSTTANGVWQCNVAGFTFVRVRGSAYTSGTAVIVINSAHASAKSGGSPFSSGGLTANLIPKSDGAGKLINSLASDSGTVLTYNSLVVPDYASGGVTAGQVPVSNGSSNLFDSSINDGRNGVVTIPGQVTHQGTLTISQLATPANATLVVTGGVGTNYTYKLVAKVGSVGTAVNSGVSTAAGPTTLDGTHFIDINFTSQNGCTSIDVYRTVGGATQGKIGNVACTTTGTALTLRDNALVGDAATAPVVNTTGTLSIGGAVTTNNNIATAGIGVPSIRAAGRSAAQTGAVGSVATYTPAADATFEISANVLVTTATSHSFTLTCAYTDEGSTARTATLTYFLVAGTSLVTAVSNTNGAVPYHGIPITIRAKGGTSITIATTGTFTTVTYNVEGIIKQVD